MKNYPHPIQLSNGLQERHVDEKPVHNFLIIILLHIKIPRYFMHVFNIYLVYTACKECNKSNADGTEFNCSLFLENDWCQCTQGTLGAVSHLHIGLICGMGVYVCVPALRPCSPAPVLTFWNSMYYWITYYFPIFYLYKTVMLIGM